MKEYYILDLNQSNGDMLVWRRSNSRGYCCRLDWAGKYTEEQIKEKPSYFDNGELTKAIPCSVVDEVSVKCVPNDLTILKKMGLKNEIKLKIKEK